MWCDESASVAARTSRRSCTNLLLLLLLSKRFSHQLVVPWSSGGTSSLNVVSCESQRVERRQYVQHLD